MPSGHGDPRPAGTWRRHSPSGSAWGRGTGARDPVASLGAAAPPPARCGISAGRCAACAAAPARPVAGGSLRMQRAFQHLSGGGRRCDGDCGGAAGGSLDGTALPHLPPEGSKPSERRGNGEPLPLLRFDVGVWSLPHTPQYCPSPLPRHEKPEKIIDFVSGIDSRLPTSPHSDPASLHLRPRALPDGAGVSSTWAPVGQPGPPSVPDPSLFRKTVALPKAKPGLAYLGEAEGIGSLGGFEGVWLPPCLPAGRVNVWSPLPRGEGSLALHPRPEDTGMGVFCQVVPQFPFSPAIQELVAG